MATPESTTCAHPVRPPSELARRARSCLRSDDALGRWRRRRAPRSVAARRRGRCRPGEHAPRQRSRAPERARRWRAGSMDSTSASGRPSRRGADHRSRPDAQAERCSRRQRPPTQIIAATATSAPTTANNRSASRRPRKTVSVDPRRLSGAHCLASRDRGAALELTDDEDRTRLPSAAPGWGGGMAELATLWIVRHGESTANVAATQRRGVGRGADRPHPPRRRRAALRDRRGAGSGDRPVAGRAAGCEAPGRGGGVAVPARGADLPAGAGRHRHSRPPRRAAARPGAGHPRRADRARGAAAVPGRGRPPGAVGQVLLPAAGRGVLDGRGVAAADAAGRPAPRPRGLPGAALRPRRAGLPASLSGGGVDRGRADGAHPAGRDRQLFDHRVVGGRRGTTALTAFNEVEHLRQQGAQPTREDEIHAEPV